MPSFYTFWDPLGALEGASEASGPPLIRYEGPLLRARVAWKILAPLQGALKRFQPCR